MKEKSSVVIVEMGLRDGLQNEKVILSPEVRVEFIAKLIKSGSKKIEAGAFVSPKWVPQMAGTSEILTQLHNHKDSSSWPKNLKFSVLIPNEQGMQEAIRHGVKEVALFASSSESFSKKNINCTIEESFERFVPVMKLARKHKIKVRAYLSVCFGCPFEGAIAEEKVVRLAKRLYESGAYEVSIGDTIGVADAGQVESLFKKLKRVVPVEKLAAHFHDTRGQALANILMAYKVGIRVFDASLGGLGGCPYAPGAAGNVATEDVVYMFHGMGVNTGLNLESLIETHQWVSQKMGKKLSSKVGNVGLLKPLGTVL